jgi:hypothetical protein
MYVSEMRGILCNLGGNADNLRPINYRTEFFLYSFILGRDSYVMKESDFNIEANKNKY